MIEPRPYSHDRDPTDVFPNLDRDSFEELAEEFAERCRRGESHSIADFERRFPEHAEKIRELLPTVALMEQLKRAGQRDRSAEISRNPTPEKLGEYRVLRELGRGGMGIVYEAVQESLGRTVALKVIHNVHLNPKRLQRFQREAQAVARLHHTNIVPIFGVGEQDGIPYYVMQYIRGIGLDGLIEKWQIGGSLLDKDRWRFVARVGVQAAEALDHAHGQGILHRDIKPPNLLIDEQETIWITDFGLAKLAGEDDLTASGDLVGTLRYIAPEALKGVTDHRSDVYSLGLTLYELLTLNAPFGDVSPSELLKQVSEARPIQPRRLAPTLPRDLETIVLKAIAREPAHRYATARAMADDLNRFLQDRPILARRANPVERVWRWSRRNRLASSMTMTAMISLLVAAVVGWVGYVKTAQALQRADQNVTLSLEVFGSLFDQLAAHDAIATPPLGEAGGPPGFRPALPRNGMDRPPDSPPETAFGGFFRFGPDHGRGLGPPGSSRSDSQEDDTALLQKILSFYDRFASQNATNPRLEGEAARAYRKVGALYERLGQTANAEVAYDRAITMYESLVQQYPTDRDYRTRLVQTYDMANPDTAEPQSLDRLERWLRRAEVVIDKLVLEDPDEKEFALLQNRVAVKLGRVLRLLDRPEEAKSAYLEAIVNETALIERLPDFDPLRIDRATTREALALIWIEEGKIDEGRKQLDQAIADLEFLMASDRSHPPLQNRLGTLANSYQKIGDQARSDQIRQMAGSEAARPRGTPHRLKTSRH